MFKNLKLFPLHLNTFDGEGGGAAGSGDGAGAGAGEVGTQGLPGSDQQAKSDVKVVYGKPPVEAEANKSPDVGGKKTSPTADAKAKEERASAFEKLINEDYKDLFTEKTQAIINKRFKDSKELETKMVQVSPLLDLLSQKYKESDPAKLLQAITSDDAMWDNLADEAGMTVDQYKKFMAMDAENKRLKQKESQIEQQRFAQERYAGWQSEAAEMQKDPMFTGFDLDKEAESNPQFVELLRAGVGVKAAYQVAHIDDIKQATARTVEKQVVSNIAAKGTRPLENGAAANVGVVYKTDPSKWTNDDLKEIEKRVRNGEKIYL